MNMEIPMSKEEIYPWVVDTLHEMFELERLTPGDVDG